MKKVFTFLVVMMMGLNLSAQQTDEQTSTYYLIRHAEKDRSNKLDKNPNLKQKGLARALKWAEVFKDVSFDEIYSTSYNRTKQTAEPTAFRQKKRITFYDPFTINIEEFIEKTQGKTVLIVGHSNTTPDFANKLIGMDKYKAMDDSDNAGLYIITLVNNVATSIRLNID